MDKGFVTSINCMDGRAQKPVIEYLEKNFGARYVDMITEPGPNKLIAEGTDEALIENLKKKVGISVEKHLSDLIVIAAHHDCAGNPVSEEAQKEHLKKAIEVVSSWNFPVKKIIALWLDENFNPTIID